MCNSLKNNVPILLIILLLSLASFSLKAQFTDDFSDGNFTQNPEWLGNSTQFIVNDAFQLQLNAEGEGESFLYTASNSLTETEWRFYIRLAFSPSGNNNARVFLAADQYPDPQNGFFVQLGEAGSNDAIEIFRLQNGTETSVCRGPDAMIASSFGVSVRIIRDNNHWQLFADPDGGDNYQLLAEADDAFDFSATKFALYCKYTSSNSTKFYFDNFYTGPILLDNTPPSIMAFQLLSSSSISLQFSEALDESPALNPANFIINNEIGQASAVSFSDEAKTTLELIVSKNFNDGKAYELLVKNQSDLNNNVMNDTILEFSMYEAAPFEIVFNEIMADPTPEVGLPAEEFLEIYNTTEIPISLESWKLVVGTTEKELPAVSISPKGYLILCKPEVEALFAPYGQTAGISGLSLANDGRLLSLLNNNDVLIHSVQYDISWYADPEKDEGGWSIEQIDPLAPCMGKNNWKASVNPAGGTPGSINSVNAPNYESPEISSVTLLDSISLIIAFNQMMDIASVTDISAYLASPVGMSPDSVRSFQNALDEFIIYFPVPFVAGIDYLLSIQKDLLNCSGTPIPAGGEFAFAMPLPTVFHEVLITEIMADPTPEVGLPPYEYIELQNVSEHAVQLNQWQLTMGSSSTTLGATVLDAGERIILIEEEAEAAFKFFGKSLVVESISLGNDGALLSLRNKDALLIHAVEYSVDWYGTSAKEEGGWSLEMIDVQSPCVQAPNWTASIAMEGGTPGQENSVAASIDAPAAPEIKYITYQNPLEISVFFDQPMDSLAMADATIYSIEPQIGFPDNAQPIGVFFDEVRLFLTEALIENTVYTLRIQAENVVSCSGQTAEEELIIEFGVPVAVDSGDVVINELLFNPYADGDDYIEIYNNSQKVLDMSTMSVVYQKDTEADPDICFLPQYLLMPGKWVAFSQSPEMVLKQYLTPYPNAVVEAENLPNFGSTEGIVALTQMSDANRTYDVFAYNEDMHYPLLRSVDGVSLERVSADVSTTEESNWHSAAESVGYGTPAAKNSVVAANVDGTEELEISPELFSPDMDGHDDLLTIAFHLDDAGYMAKIQIFDSRGRLVRNLGGNMMPGNEAEYFWDGINNDGNKASIGIYIIYVELYNPEGNVKTFKESVTLGGQW